MKRLDLSITDKAYNQLKNDLALKKMTGNLFGIIDGITLKIVQAIEDESPDTTIMLRNEMETITRKTRHK